jgi:excisionase family DNA binding protein
MPQLSSVVEQSAARPANAQRLLDLRSAAAYLGLSVYTVRELAWKGALPRVRISLPDGSEVRKLLFDRADLDKLIEAWKEAG